MTRHHPRSHALADALTRRWDGRITWKRGAQKVGVSEMTIARYMRGEVPLNPADRILTGLDAASEWTVGTSRNILDGRITPDQAVELDEHQEQSDDDTTQLARDLAEIFQKHRATAARLIRVLGDRASDHDVRQEIDAWFDKDELLQLMLEREKKPDDGRNARNRTEAPESTHNSGGFGTPRRIKRITDL